MLERGDIDIVLLDVMLPGEDGFSICRLARAEGVTTPILVLTARDAVEDRIRGLDAGADDYVAKPFAEDELAARVRALLRRTQSAGAGARNRMRRRMRRGASII